MYAGYEIFTCTVLNSIIYLFLGLQSAFLCSTLPVVVMMWCILVRSSRLCLSMVDWRSSSTWAEYYIVMALCRSFLFIYYFWGRTLSFRSLSRRCTNSFGGCVSMVGLVDLSCKIETACVKRLWSCNARPTFSLCCWSFRSSHFFSSNLLQDGVTVLCPLAIRTAAIKSWFVDVVTMDSWAN